MVQWALFYAGLGFKVFPLEPNRKEPFRNFAWREEATDDVGQIIFWWSRVPDANIGIACGEPSGVTVLDLDVKGEGNGWESVGGLLDVEHTAWAQTPSGGYHFYYVHTPALGNHSFKREGVDVQGTGAYVLAVPSVVDGKPYAWGHDLTSTGLERPPFDLLAWVHARRDQAAPGQAGMPDVPEEWLEHDTFPEPWMLGLSPDQCAFIDGDDSKYPSRSEGLYGIACSLVRRYEDDSMVLALLMHWAPGAAEDRRGQDAATWMWRYVVVPARRQHEKLRAAAQQMVSPVETPQEPHRDPTETPSNQFAALRSEILLLPPGDVPAAAQWMAKLVGMEDIYVEPLMKDLSSHAGVTLKTLRGELARMKKAVDAQRRRETFKDEPTPMWERYAYITGMDRIYDLQARQFVKTDAFRKTYNIGQDDIHDEAFIQGKMKRFDAITYWPGMKSGVEVSLEGRQCLNTWTPSTLAPAEGDASPWLDLFKHMRMKPEEAEHVLDYFAFMLQHPGRKINHGLVLGGAHGIGKDTLLEPVKRAVGYHNVGTPGGELLLSQFNDWAAGKKLVVFQEVAVASRREAKDIEHKLKPVLAAPPSSLSIHPKGLPVYEVPNLLQLVVVTNDRHPLHVSSGDRRYFMTWAQWKPNIRERKQWAPFWSDFHRWLDTGGDAVVLSYLLNRDVSAFDPGAAPPVTEWREDAADSSLSDVALEVRDRLNDGFGAFGWDVATAEDLAGAMLGVMVHGRPVGKRAIANALGDLGYTSYRKRHPGNTTLRYYILRNEERWSVEDVTAAEILGYMKAQKIL